MPLKVGSFSKYKEFQQEHPWLAFVLILAVIFFEIAAILKLFGVAPEKSFLTIFFDLSSTTASVLLPAVVIFAGQMTIHEGGHALVAKLLGWKIKQVNIGPVTWQLRPTGWVRVWNQTKLMPAGGYVATHPEPGKYRARDYFFIVAAGFVMNVLATLLIFILLPIAATNIWRDTLWLMFIASIICTLTFPLLDAQYLFTILFKKRNWGQLLELSEYIYAWSNWTRPRDFDIESIRAIGERTDQEQSIRDSAQVMEAFYYWDLGDANKALEFISNLKDARSIKAAQTERAFLEEIVPDVVRVAPLGVINAYSHPRYKAFRYYCNGDYEGCIEYGEKAIEKYKKYVLAHRPSADFQYELMELLIRKAKMQLNAPPVQ
ncbi:MAG: M50 family metallopeptidase [Fimbriimonadaceae bacterium]|nr:MAG: M50 family metallopeptidase [Fimbriimonadaceae bacterium]